LIIGSAGGDPGLGEIEHELALHAGTGFNNRNVLVLIHRSDTPPSGTKRWLSPRQLQRHHHAFLESPGDIARIARFLTGRAVGIALGGGFARGIAHAGVFRAFADAGIAIDAVGGTSMGAVVGAQYARGWDSDVIVSETSAGYEDALSDLTFRSAPHHAGKKFSSAISRLTGDVQIEDLRLPYFCVSANLNRAALKIHTEGSLTKAVLASTRAPGIFPPIIYDGELHVDGGVLNNVPVDLMKGFCNGGFVVGVDVSPPHELNTIQDYGVEVSGWQALKRRFSPIGRKTCAPSIPLVMMRTLEFGGISHKSAIAETADLYLRPPLLEFKRTDFARAAEIAEVGYHHARQKIREWLNTRDDPSGSDHGKSKTHNK
jgi:NTE family protein/lysophospholipid hydrolase